MLIDLRGQVATLRIRLEGAFQLLGVHFDPLREASLLRQINGRLDAQLRSRALAYGNLVRRLHPSHR